MTHRLLEGLACREYHQPPKPTCHPRVLTAEKNMDKHEGRDGGNQEGLTKKQSPHPLCTGGAGLTEKWPSRGT